MFQCRGQIEQHQIGAKQIRQFVKHVGRHRVLKQFGGVVLRSGIQTERQVGMGAQQKFLGGKGTLKVIGHAVWRPNPQNLVQGRGAQVKIQHHAAGRLKPGHGKGKVGGDKAAAAAARGRGDGDTGPALFRQCLQKPCAQHVKGGVSGIGPRRRDHVLAGQNLRVRRGQQQAFPIDIGIVHRREPFYGRVGDDLVVLLMILGHGVSFELLLRGSLAGKSGQKNGVNRVFAPLRILTDPLRRWLSEGICRGAVRAPSQAHAWGGCCRRARNARGFSNPPATGWSGRPGAARFS